MSWQDPTHLGGVPKRESGLLPGVVPRRRRRVGAGAAASEMLGIQVSTALPLQRHPPVVVLAISVAEIAALAFLILTGSIVGLALLVLVSLVLLIVDATNRHRVLAFTSQGHVALAASKKGQPRAVIGPLPGPLALPEPAGLGGPVQIDGVTWWVDRSAFRFLRDARELLQADGEDDGGEGEDHRHHDGDAVEVALDHRRPGGRRTEATAEHLGEPTAAPAVQEDQHDEGEGHHHMDHEQDDGHGTSLGDDRGQAAR